MPEPEPISVRQVIYECLRHNTAGFAKSTLSERAYILHKFAGSSAADKLVSEAVPLDLVAWINSHSRWSQWRRKGVAASIKAAMMWAERIGLIPRGQHPYREISFRAGRRRRPATDREIQDVLRGSDAEFRRLVIFCAMTGARPGELYGAEWSHVDLDAMALTLTEHKTASATGKVRHIHLHPSLVKLLVWLKRNKPHERWILTNAYGGRWKPTAVAYRLKMLRKRVDLPADFTLSTCRHRFTTDGIRAGVELVTLAQLLGHARVSTTMHYMHFIADSDRCQAALNKIHRRKRKPDQGAA